jgi:hypothetical protein
MNPVTIGITIGYLIYGFGATWLVWRTWKTFGWEGLAIKVALFWDFLFVASVVMFRKIPRAHWVIPKPDPGLGLNFYLAAAVLAWGGYMYVLLSDRPTRWLLSRPTLKWTSYSLAAFVFLGTVGF